MPELPYYYCYGGTYSGCTAYKTLPAQRAGDMQASTIRPAVVGLLGMRTRPGQVPLGSPEFLLGLLPCA